MQTEEGNLMSDISPTTGESFYSGTWSEIQDILRVIDIGEGKMAKVTQPMVNGYQETIDRDIDAILGELYHVPLRAMNQMQPDGVTKRVFPGDVRRCAKYWVAGLLLLNEFQSLAQNITDQATQYVDDSKRQIYAMKRYTHRLPGQERKSHLSRTIPPNFQPASVPEQDF
jgi:hypothetical protein